MNYEIQRTITSSKVIKLELKDGKTKIGRAFLYIIENDLHKRPYGLLEDLFVNEKYRGTGLGKQLLLMAVKEAKKRKLYKLIGTSRSSRAEVHSFYEKHGFKKYGFEFRLNIR
ncbi:MAG: GNAT family N-acetyltransferase [Candidatus Doudnabacteria bacterium]|nr:GNAT family N-acetyltransferase [Candidatus Doudnabacteria bacterium]